MHIISRLLARRRRAARTPDAGFLARLRRDRRANTLVLMAAALFPLLGLAGSGVDMARLYVVKSRLQQACDAGVLAGRKFMSAQGSTLDREAAAQAQTFFKNNFTSGWLDTGTASFTPVKTTDSQVAATASVNVPMTIMKVFDANDAVVSVACKARFDVADTDIVFVLDTTGSMAESPSGACGMGSWYSYTRPSTPDGTPGYRGSTGYAVRETTCSGGSKIAALRTAVKEFYGIIASSTTRDVRIRYGFVPYSSTVNAGQALFSVSAGYLIGGKPGEYATYQSREKGLLNLWSYKPVSLPVSNFLKGNAVPTPASDSSSATSKWEGCVEEPYTEGGTTTFTAKSIDLDPASIPGNNDATRWKPSWPDVTYYRNSLGFSNGKPMSDKEQIDENNYNCVKPVHRLSEMTSNDVDDYVDAADFAPNGNTYHDLGMMWGVRLLSKDGIFAADNQPRPNQGTPRKVIVFLTDGNMATRGQVYGQYGIEDLEHRIRDGSFTSAETFHNARLLYMCQRARDLGIDVWTVAIGLRTTTSLRQCARTSTQALDTMSGSGLSTIFQRIARQIAQLRMEQ